MERRIEESEAMQAMFGDDVEVHADALADLTAGKDVALPISVKIKSGETEDVIECNLILPIGYPGEAALTLTLRSATIRKAALVGLSTQLLELAEERRAEGAEAVFDIVTAVQERIAAGFEEDTPKLEEKPKRTLKHILMKTGAELLKVKERLEKGEEFGAVARQTSTCSSKIKGGSLGTVSPGEMAPEIDAICFSPDTPKGEVIGPIQTKFGYHLLVVLDEDASASSAARCRTIFMVDQVNNSKVFLKALQELADGDGLPLNVFYRTINCMKNAKLSAAVDPFRSVYCVVDAPNKKAAGEFFKSLRTNSAMDTDCLNKPCKQAGSVLEEFELPAEQPGVVGFTHHEYRTDEEIEGHLKRFRVNAVGPGASGYSKK